MLASIIFFVLLACLVFVCAYGVAASDNFRSEDIIIIVVGFVTVAVCFAMYFSALMF